MVLGGFLVLLPLLLAAPAAGVAQAQEGERCFPETGQCISGAIRAFWEQNGGLAVFGLPIGPQQATTGEDGQVREAQWFERHRLELHPENQPPYNVQLGRLGVDRLTQQGRDWRAFPPLDLNNADAERCAFFRETNHQVCDEFLQAFRSNGLSFVNTPGVTYAESLALFGLPISEAMTETVEGREYTVQWFERARFELHPENQPSFRVLFGRLGAELGGGAAGSLVGREWQLVAFGPNNAPTPAVAEPVATLGFEAGNVFGSTGCNRVRGPYSATDTTITFSPLASTLALCTSDALTAQEQAILGALQGAVPYQIAGDELRLSYDGGRQTLRYRAVPPLRLAGQPWQLVAFGPNNAPTPAVAEPAATLSFDGAQVSGSTGCNSFSGGYQATGTTITFGPLAATLRLCTDEGLTTQEQAILGALQGAVPYQIAGDELRLSYDGGRQTLVYEVADE
ncbi:MAG: hypothetical protein OHK0015_41270 [Chloroflexi bacterium OHK40]